MIAVDESIKIDARFYKVEQIRRLTNEAFVVRMPKPRFQFRPGQHISLGIHGDYQSREYSIYSGVNDPWLEVLVKEVEEGYFSPKLGRVRQGSLLEVNGPFGKFGIDSQKAESGRFVFLASGTGIAPFHSMISSYPGLNYTLVHGVRYGHEAYERHHYEQDRYVLCTSRDREGDVHGRLTSYLKQASFEPDTHFYLCGNSEMIFDALEILKDKGFERDQMHCEVYF